MHTVRLAFPRIRPAHAAESRALLTLAAVVTVFGLVMVLSASSVEEIASGASPFAAFVRQAGYATVGVPLMFVASRLPAEVWRRWAGTVLAVGVGLQLIVLFTPLGETVQGNRNWLRLGPVSAQPSELVKLGAVLSVAALLERRAAVLRAPRRLLGRDGQVRRVYVPAAVLMVVAVVPVLVGRDLGTSMVIVAGVFGALLFGEVPSKHLAVAAVGSVTVALLLAVTRASRLGRIGAWLSGCGGAAQQQGACWQPVHADWALAAGGLFGRGLGLSQMKWSWLPEADNDFVYAVIGEELGLVGAIGVVAAFVAIAVVFLRMIRKNRSLFRRAAVGGIMFWVVGQAVANIAVVLGLLPVLGVPLPLISAGGSSLVVTLVGLGAAASMAAGGGAAARPSSIRSMTDVIIH